MSESKISSGVKKCLGVLTMATMFCGAGFAQTHLVDADFGTRVNGPNSNFTMNLTVNPADVDVAGFTIKIRYDNTQVQLVSVSDNTGQPAANVDYLMGNEQLESLPGSPNVNAYRVIQMDTDTDLITPSNIAELHFTSTAAYNDPNNKVWLQVEDGDDPDAGLIGRDGSGNFVHLDTSYDPGTQQVPVTVSGFTLE